MWLDAGYDLQYKVCYLSKNGLQGNTGFVRIK